MWLDVKQVQTNESCNLLVSLVVPLMCASYAVYIPEVLHASKRSPCCPCLPTIEVLPVVRKLCAGPGGARGSQGVNAEPDDGNDVTSQPSVRNGSLSAGVVRPPCQHQ